VANHNIDAADHATSSIKRWGFLMPKKQKYFTRKLAKAVAILNIAPNVARHREVYRRMDWAGYWWDVNRQMWIKRVEKGQQ